MSASADSEVKHGHDSVPVTETKLTKGDFEQLIFAAGLEVSNISFHYSNDSS